MANFKSNLINNDTGVVIQSRIGEQTNVLFVQKALADNRNTGTAVTELRDRVATVSESLSARANDLTHTGFVKAASEAIARSITPAFQTARKAIIAANDDLQKRFSDFDKPRFTEEQSPSVRVELRQYARTLSLPDLIEATRRDPVLAAAVIEGGDAMSGLPADIIARLREELMVANAARRMGSQSDYRTKPSADDPLGGQPDHAAARAAGERLVAGLRAEREVLASAPAMLGSVVTLVALLTDTTRDAAFVALTAA